ncbi:GFA family protein [uncultured Pseudoteredinibacter sp.]|uniref:GFA family protein n=1 Tax=uncultured Pseudoteredinibacter sp. TaxID=1641701 RepID=UPI0026146B18|nr:GFA family protein [uncultured Pseudoteredinibacter sp.]
MTNKDSVRYQGSCLCGAIQYEILAEPVTASHCHCKMCQKQHGAAFASYARIRRSELRYTKGQDTIKRYQSSEKVERSFCSECGSNLEWGYTEGEWAHWVAIALGSFDTPYSQDIYRELHTEDKAPWWQP